MCFKMFICKIVISGVANLLIFLLLFLIPKAIGPKVNHLFWGLLKYKVRTHFTGFQTSETLTCLILPAHFSISSLCK